MPKGIPNKPRSDPAETKRPDTKIYPVGVSRTKQSFKKESDINAIMAKYASTGLLERVNLSVPRYGDFGSVGDYQQCLDKIQEADRQFNDLPARVRDHVDNDPGEFLRMALDPKREQELRDLGLLPIGEVPEVPPGVDPKEVRVAPEPVQGHLPGAVEGKEGK